MAPVPPLPETLSPWGSFVAADSNTSGEKLVSHPVDVSTSIYLQRVPIVILSLRCTENFIKNVCFYKKLLNLYHKIKCETANYFFFIVANNIRYFAGLVEKGLFFGYDFNVRPF